MQNNNLGNISKNIITPVILAGGSGTRLWPLSRRHYPKQFIDLFGVGSLFQAACERVKDRRFNAPIILTSYEHRFLVAEQMRQINIEPGQIILEPVGRNTAPAILIASLLAGKKDEDPLLLVMPADHKIDDSGIFCNDVVTSIDLAKKGNIITFGVTPDSPNTGYGYIETSSAIGELFKVKRFIEKPNYEKAKGFVKSGKYYWNAGIFLFSASSMINAFKKHHPTMFKYCEKSLAGAKKELKFLRLEENSFANCKNISIDYAVMEKAPNIFCKPLSSNWSDIGSWSALAEQFGFDEKGNSSYGNDVVFHKTSGCFGYSGDGVDLTLIGLKDVITVVTKDSVLVVAKDKVGYIEQAIRQKEK